MHIQERRWLASGVPLSMSQMSSSRSQSPARGLRNWFRRVYATLLWLMLLLIASWVILDRNSKMTQTAESVTTLTPTLQRILRK